MKLMTFDAGNGARVGLVNEAGIVDLTKHAGVTSLRGLIADGKVDEMAAHAGAAADVHITLTHTKQRTADFH